MVSDKLVILIVFVIAYALFIWKYEKKHYTVWAAIILFLFLGYTNGEVAYSSIDWNVMGIFIGMFIIAELFIRSDFPDMLANQLAQKSKKSWMAILMLCALSGFLSIFLENVATVLIIAPIAIAIAKELEQSPTPFLIGIAISSNLQGVATLIGDPPSIILGGFANLTFNDFFVFQGKPSLFFAVQIAMIAGLIVLYFLFRHHKNPIPHFDAIRVKSFVPFMIIIVMIIVLIITSTAELLPGTGHVSAGLICLSFALIGALWYITTKEGHHKHIVRSIDWETTLFLVGIFILVGTLVNHGIINDLGNFIQSVVGENVLLIYVTLIVIAVVFSAFIDNVPFVVTMLPVAQILANNIGIEPYLFYFGLLIGASVGGNITPVGASANIVAMGMLKQHEEKVNFWDFVKIGLPFTLVSVFFSALFIWLMFKP